MAYLTWEADEKVGMSILESVPPEIQWIILDMVDDHWIKKGFSTWADNIKNVISEYKRIWDGNGWDGDDDLDPPPHAYIVSFSGLSPVAFNHNYTGRTACYRELPVKPYDERIERFVYVRNGNLVKSTVPLNY